MLFIEDIFPAEWRCACPWQFRPFRLKEEEECSAVFFPLCCRKWGLLFVLIVSAYCVCPSRCAVHVPSIANNLLLRGRLRSAEKKKSSKHAIITSIEFCTSGQTALRQKFWSDEQGPKKKNTSAGWTSRGQKRKIHVNKL